MIHIPEVGDIVRQSTFGDTGGKGDRLVKVTDLDFHAGRPSFNGIIVDASFNEVESELEEGPALAWGYVSQIVERVAP